MSGFVFRVDDAVDAIDCAGAVDTGIEIGVLHATHFRIRGAQPLQAHTSPQGRNTTVAGASEHTTHSPTWKYLYKINVIIEI